MLHFLATNSIKITFIPPYSLDLTLEDFFAILKRKSELVEIWLAQKTFKKGLDGAFMTIFKDNIATPFQ
jgi:transposase